MKNGIIFTSGVVVGIIVTIIYVYNFLFLFWVESDLSVKKAENQLMKIHLEKLQAGNIEDVIGYYKLQLEFTENNIKDIENERK